MDLLITILTCSLYASDDAVVRAIAEGPSGNNPYLVLDPVADSADAGVPPFPKSEAEATARAKGLMAQGGRPLLGLLELLPAWLDLFGRPLSLIHIYLGRAVDELPDGAHRRRVQRPLPELSLIHI